MRDEERTRAEIMMGLALVCLIIVFFQQTGHALPRWAILLFAVAAGVVPLLRMTWRRQCIGVPTHRTPLHAMAAALGQLHLAVAAGLLVWALAILHPEPALTALCAALIALLSLSYADDGRAK